MYFNMIFFQVEEKLAKNNSPPLKPWLVVFWIVLFLPRSFILLYHRTTISSNLLHGMQREIEAKT